MAEEGRDILKSAPAATEQSLTGRKPHVRNATGREKLIRIFGIYVQRVTEPVVIYAMKAYPADGIKMSFRNAEDAAVPAKFLKRIPVQHAVEQVQWAK